LALQTWVLLQPPQVSVPPQPSGIEPQLAPTLWQVFG
jgi:hypothetical protein